MNSLSRFTLRFLSFTALFPFFLSSCLDQVPPLLPAWPAWKYSDLRSMDPVDSSNPGMDFLAAYTRENGDEIQIRFDFLDLEQEPSFDLNLVIDLQPGGKTAGLDSIPDSNIGWDIFIETGSSDKIEMHSPFPELKIERLRVLRSPTEDTLTISFSSSSFRRTEEDQISLAAWISPHKEASIVDSIGPIKFFTTPPKQTYLVFYFWNLFDGASPAQALRRWNGAHSGPDSARHGLVHLLYAVEEMRLPVILSDINTPENLSALDYLSVLDRIRRLAREELITLPEVSTINLSTQPAFSIPDFVYETSLAWKSQVAQEFLMPDAQALVVQQWPTELNFPDRYRIIFPATISPLSSARLCSYGQTRVLCRAENAGPLETVDPYSQVDEEGLTLEAKKSLVNAALSVTESIIFLGGDFGLSSWGNPGYSLSAFEYVQNHPWIRVLSLGDLKTWHLQYGFALVLPQPPNDFVSFVPETFDDLPIPSKLSTEEINARVLNALELLPNGPLASAAWQWYFELLSARSSEHHQLNAATLGQLGHMISAALWADKPYTLTDCELDLDWDGENECVLASNQLFISLEPAGGSVVIGVLRTQEGVQQLIAPTYQVISGISDPFLWKPERGILGDPNASQGAFEERANFREDYKVSVIRDGVVESSNVKLAMRKIYTLSSSSLEVKYLAPGTTIVSGNLVNNPWERFNPSWATTYTRSNVQLFTNAEISHYLFTSSREYLGLPEDPNFDYTAGHHQLFPFDSFTIVGQDEFWIRLEWSR